jgi:nucleoside 2-deoxyribosyltransferase
MSRKISCFLAMPFKKEFQPVSDCIDECAEALLNEGKKIYVKRADRDRTAADIAQNVSNNIIGSDIVIIDATEFNANVMFEFGYAKAKGKIIIPIIQGSRSGLPTDFNQYIFESYKLDELDGLRLRLKNRLREAITLLEQIDQTKKLQADVTIEQSEFEVVCIKDRQHARLDRCFAAARKDIRIIQTNMTTVVDEYLPGIEEAICASREAGNHLSVYFLALDPESYFTAIRAQQLGMDVSEFRSELHRALKKLHERMHNYKEVEIRLYDDFPTQICFIVDGEIYNCVVSKYQQSRNNCLFRLDSRYPVLHTSFILHFTSVWRDTKTTKRYHPSSHRDVPPGEIQGDDEAT